MKPLRFRQIHLDFHTSPLIPGIGGDWDAKAFASTMAAAHVNSVTCFAKCHHGHLYYETSHAARHPNLRPGLDLLAEQVQALHEVGINAPVYISVQCDEYAANTHPEWLALKPDGSPVGAGPFDAGWHILDMNSPYQEYLVEQVREIMQHFAPVDGVFFDMCWDQPNCSKWAVEAMLREGMNPQDERDRKTHARSVALAYLSRLRTLVGELNAQHGGDSAANVAFNSRPLDNLPEEIRYLRHVEIEALPTGGWGYVYFPLNVRYVRTFGVPYLGMTARFHKSWADFGGLKTEAALRYECTQMLAHGAACSIGDQMHPRGTLDLAAYQRIGRVYQYVESCEPWCRQATAMTDIAVLREPLGDYHLKPGDASEGVVRSLQELHHQFDFASADADLRSYRLLIVPDGLPLSPRVLGAIRSLVDSGKPLLLALSHEQLLPDDLCARLGISVAGPAPFTTTYLRFAESIQRPDFPRTDHVNYERGCMLKAGDGAVELCQVIEPYFQRRWDHFSSHFQTPPDPNRLAPYSAAVQSGNHIIIGFPLFQAYATHGSASYRELLDCCIERLLPDPLLRVPAAPRFLETSVMRQPNGIVVHLLSYCPQRRTPTIDLVDDPIMLRNQRLLLRCQSAPERVTLQPQGQSLPFEHDPDGVHIVVPEINGHQMVVFSGKRA